MKKSGTFLVYNRFNSPIVLSWQLISGKTELLDTKLKELTPLLVPTYLEQEFGFAQKCPELAAEDFMLKSIAPLLAKQPIDWLQVKEEIKKILTDFFASINWSQYSGAEDCNIFVIARDQNTKQKLGVIQFLLRPEFGENNVKAALFGVLPAAHNQGIEELLISSIFKIQPTIKRIFLHTRTTNQQLIERCKSWEFTEFSGPLAHWIDLEYLAEKSETLQKIAAIPL